MDQFETQNTVLGMQDSAQMKHYPRSLNMLETGIDYLQDQPGTVMIPNGYT